MKRRVERVRVGLIAGSVMLLVVLAGLLGYSRYRAGKAWLSRLKDRSGASLVRETDGFTYSQSLKGKTVFTLHAAKAFQHKDGHWVLHDVVVTLYGQHDDRVDRVYGNEFEWDENQGIARAVGEVQMDLQVPAGIAASNARSGPAAVKGDSPESVHVRTSGLVFVRQFGVAATHEQVEFRYGGLTCLSKGAEFESSPSALHLLGDVRVNGVLRGEPVALTATKADLDRVMNTASFVSPVLTSKGRTAHAQGAVLHLRKDGSVERAEATGDVALDAEARHVKAQRLDATLSEKNEPETARLSGGVRVVDEDARHPAQGEAAETRLRFDAQGRPAEIVAAGGAHLSVRQAGENGAWLQREMRGDQILSTFRAEGKAKPQLQQVHVVGAASMRGDSLAKVAGLTKPEVRSTRITGDDLVMNFVSATARSVRVEKLHGQGHTALRQTGELAENQVSLGDSLDVVFAADGKQTSVASAVQVGHISISSLPALKPGAKKPQELSTATAERAAYDGASERLELNGGVHFASGGTSMTADALGVDQKTGDADAHGNVTATLVGKGAQATHVTAQEAVLHKATQVAEFSGGSKPVRLWQEASQVEAAGIVIDQLKNTLVARPAVGGVVRSVFAGEQVKGGSMPVGGKKGASVLRVESRGLEYSDALHQAVFTGPVRIDGAPGEVRGQRTVATFVPAAKGAGGGGLMGGALDRVVVSGDVRLEAPGRHGTGEEVVYKAVDGSVLLTGTPGVPPRIVDAQQGTVTGNSLLFRAGGSDGDSTIVVSGTSPGEQRPQRAHIETHVRQKAQQ